MPRLNRKEMQSQTRSKLLASAEDVIARQGVEAASIRDIAEAAGYSLGAFYSNFKTKEAMLLELMHRHMREEIHAFRGITERAKEDSLEEQLHNISAWLKDMGKNKNLPVLGLEFQMYANRNASFRKKFDQSKALRQAELAEGFKTIFERRGLVPEMDPLQIAVGFSALWSGFAMHGNVSSTKPVDQIIMVFLKALLDSAAPVQKPHSIPSKGRSK